MSLTLAIEAFSPKKYAVLLLPLTSVAVGAAAMSSSRAHPKYEMPS
jgi:hypothetical protein